MTGERETEISDCVASSAAAVENPGPSDLLEVTFQKNPSQKYKYLEAEPKILGVTEIALSIFLIGSTLTRFSVFSIETYVDTAFSCVSIIAGSLAIAAEKLHLPTLKACLGMQIVTCVVYGIFIINLLRDRPYPANFDCWNHWDNGTLNETEEHICTILANGFRNLELIDQLTAAVQIALSITLAAYCCKVIQCCSPRSHVPVIIMKSLTAPE